MTDASCVGIIWHWCLGCTSLHAGGNQSKAEQGTSKQGTMQASMDPLEPLRVKSTVLQPASTALQPPAAYLGATSAWNEVSRRGGGGGVLKYCASLSSACNSFIRAIGVRRRYVTRVGVSSAFHSPSPALGHSASLHSGW